jgi:protein phosphatase
MNDPRPTPTIQAETEADPAVGPIVAAGADPGKSRDDRDGEVDAGPSPDQEVATAPNEGGLADLASNPTELDAPEPCKGETASIVGDASAPVPTMEAPPDAVAGSDLEAGDTLEELVLPSLVNAPAVLASGAQVGPERRLRVGQHLDTTGQVNRYAATWREEDGQEMAVELREAPADHLGLQREAEILASLQYAMLPRAHQTWLEDGRRYLVVDRVDGETLDAALRSGLSTERALSVAIQLTQAVRRLQQAGWALLGLTPADVVLGQPLRIVRLGQAERIGATPTRALDRPGYSAPELAYGEAVTGQEDVYTLGAIVYQALAGQPLLQRGVDLAELADGIRLPGGPQLLAAVLAPAEDRPDVDALYQQLLALKRRHAASSPSLEVASATTLGLNPTRLANEDSSCYAIWARTGEDGAGETALLCVADGMGGMEAGEVASQTAVQVVMHDAVGMLWPPSEHRQEPTSEHDDQQSAEVGARPGPRIDAAALVRRAATAVHAAAQGRQLGTTITCVVVHDGELTLAHVGDTRAYLLRGGTLTHLTFDHSLVAAMVASGVITAEEAKGHPDSNKVLRSLGSQRELPPRYVDGLEAAYGVPSLRLEIGDWLLLCSDGVWGTVDDPEIQVILVEALDAQNAARALVNRAIQAGAPDNATAVAARCVQRPVL